ncbi:MAG: hydrogen gas-evolving membrane-bound hydrogenase subunit E [Fidelibacterota bacterium]
MVRKFLVFLLLVALGFVFFTIVSDYTLPETLGPTARHYGEKGISETGALNLVTAVLVTYRGLDTLGEVTVLFLVASIFGFYLKQENTRRPAPVSPLLYTASGMILPLILLTGIYIIVNGHLSPGGGFQGGAFLASAFLLTLLAGTGRQLSTRLFSVIESSSGFVYVLLGLAGLFFAGGFLDSRLLPGGIPGKLISAGTIPLVSILIGLKVGAELSSMLIKLTHSDGEA